MRITYLSDLHLELQPFDQRLLTIEPGDVCILAGDIMSAAYLPDRRTDADARKGRAKFRKLLDLLSSKFEHILYVMGNHEHYDSFFYQTPIRIREFLQKHDYQKVQLLDRGTAVIKGVRFHGCTLWTDFNRADPIAMHQCYVGMNDYRWIGLEDTTLINPNFVLERFKEDLGWLIEQVGGPDDSIPSDMANVVITHHAPSLNAEPPYKTPLSPAFASDLTFMALHDIMIWIHGHTHFNTSYNLYEDRVPVRMNMKGYDFERINFSPNKRFEIIDERRLIELD